MTRALLSIGAALALAAAALPTSASAQKGHGGGISAGGFARGGGGAPNIGARGGGGAAVAAPRAGGGSFVAPRGAGAAYAAVPRSGGGVAMAAPRAGGSWSGGHRLGRHHARRGAFALGFVAPYYYDDYATSYVAADDCYELQQVRTAWGWQYQRVYVCD
jgi:hypothetical protein